MNKNDATEFVIDCLTDPGNIDKQAALDQWLQESEENRALYAELQQLWEATAGVPPMPFNVAEGWDELSQKIMPPAKTRRMFPLWVAAAVVLLLISGLLWWLSVPHNSVITYVASPVEKDSLELPDGTLVYLRPGTSLRYDKKFKVRTVALLEGEAYFAVVPDVNREFVVTAATSTVKVLGTAFNVRLYKTYTEVIVCEGKVSLQSQNKQIILKAETDNRGTAEKNNGEIRQHHGNYANRCVWATNELVFENEEAQFVADVIAEYYHKPKSTITDSLKHKRLTVRFSNTSYEEAMLIFDALLDE